MNKQQAKQRMAQIAMMPSVVMIGIDNGCITIGMELEKADGKDDLPDILIGLMTAYVGINQRAGLTGDELIERTAKTMAVIIANMGMGRTETAETQQTIH